LNADEIYGSWVGNIETGSPFHRKKPFNMDFGIPVSDFPWSQSQKIHKTPIFHIGKAMDSGLSKLLELPRMAETYRMITGDFSGQWSEEQRLIQVDRWVRPGQCGLDRSFLFKLMVSSSFHSP